MKKLEKKLSLNKETISNLNNNQMINIHGGAAPKTFLSICRSCINTNCATQVEEQCLSTPQFPATCQGATCQFLDGCAPMD